jgi:hypothetical protein
MTLRRPVWVSRGLAVDFASSIFRLLTGHERLPRPGSATWSYAPVTQHRRGSRRVASQRVGLRCSIAGAGGSEVPPPSPILRAGYAMRPRTGRFDRLGVQRHSVTADSVGPLTPTCTSTITRPTTRRCCCGRPDAKASARTSRRPAAQRRAGRPVPVGAQEHSRGGGVVQPQGAGAALQGSNTAIR